MNGGLPPHGTCIDSVTSLPANIKLNSVKYLRFYTAPREAARVEYVLYTPVGVFYEASQFQHSWQLKVKDFGLKLQIYDKIMYVDCLSYWMSLLVLIRVLL